MSSSLQANQKEGHLGKKCRVVVLISGRGSNLRALLLAARAENFPATIALVVGERESSGCVFAREAGIETVVLPYKTDPQKKFDENFETQLDKLLRLHSIKLVCLAGFMRILSPIFVGNWQGRILNIHPSLLPKLRGLNTHQRAIAEGHQEHGCSVHLVTEKLDEGEIIRQSKLKIYANNSPENLAARVLKLEHKLYPQALAHYVQRMSA